MYVCFPVEENKGLESAVYSHFGSAPMFIRVNTADNTFTVLMNANLNHQHGMCQPLQALSGHEVDAIVLGGIGAGALSKLQAAGIATYQAGAATVRENLALLAQKTLSPMSGSCSHHHGSGCGH